MGVSTLCTSPLLAKSVLCTPDMSAASRLRTAAGVPSVSAKHTTVVARMTLQRALPHQRNVTYTAAATCFACLHSMADDCWAWKLGTAENRVARHPEQARRLRTQARGRGRPTAWDSQCMPWQGSAGKVRLKLTLMNCCRETSTFICARRAGVSAWASPGFVGRQPELSTPRTFCTT